MRRALTVPRAIEVVLDPVLVLLWLLALVASLGKPMDAHVLVASLLVFALTFPGNVKLTDAVPTVIGKSLLTALVVLVALGLLEYLGAWITTTTIRRLLPWLAGLPALLVGANLIARAGLRRVLELTGGQDTAVVCGINRIGVNLAARLRASPYVGIKLLGYFDDRARERLPPVADEHFLGAFTHLTDFARLRRVDRIYLALPMATQPRILKILEDLKDTTASIYFAPDIFVTELINGRVETVGGMPVLAVRDTPFLGVNALVKRAEDIVLSTLALLAAAPVFLAAAVAIRLDSPGPVLFRQRRYGLDGREIGVCKFRTMTVVEDGAGQFAAARRDDRRITRVGRFLRRSSLDELPQLLNVIRGEMSIVGPRPHAVAMNEQFRKLIPGYMLRHKVKPGITGLAQVRGQRGGDDVDSLRARIASDLEYLSSWSLGMDIAILLRTLPVLAGDKSAY
jgi:putative colanic acid biosynthesis UDP-glucose lipid carrier transferase